MADYYTHFSFLVPFSLDGDKAQDERHVQRIVTELTETIEDANENDGNDTFTDDSMPYALTVEAHGTEVWITDDAGESGVEAAEAAVRWLLDQPGSPDVVSFEWANTCSKPRTDAYGGGAMVIAKGHATEWLNTGTWVSDAHRRLAEQLTGVWRRKLAGQPGAGKEEDNG